MSHSQSFNKPITVICSTLFILALAALGGHTSVLAQAGESTPTPTGQATTYTVQAGDTLSKIASLYGVTVDQLIAWNNVENPNIIHVGQVLVVGESAEPRAPAATPTPSTVSISHTVQAGETLTRIGDAYGVTVENVVFWNDIPDPNVIDIGQVLSIHVPAGWTPLPVPLPAGGPLSFTWSLVDWRPDDPNYIATLKVQSQGGQPPYTVYHDGLTQQSQSFEVAWRRCRPKPGSIGVTDANGTRIVQDYWLLAPYCPTGVEIIEPAEGAHLKHMPRRFNVTWQATIDPPPALYGMEIQVWQDGDWAPFRSYDNFASDLFFVPDQFPGDLAGRVRMWGIYEGIYAGPKTPWRYFEFRVTY